MVIDQRVYRFKVDLFVYVDETGEVLDATFEEPSLLNLVEATSTDPNFNEDRIPEDFSNIVEQVDRVVWEDPEDIVEWVDSSPGERGLEEAREALTKARRKVFQKKVDNHNALKQDK